jgi:hypothetical protein
MKLWIRSADREHFTEAHGIDYNMGYIVNSMTEEERYCHKIVDDRGKVLGIYETKERCLEIIDEIQHYFILICDCKSNATIKDLEEIIKRKGSILHLQQEPLVEAVVYKMPEE